MVACFPQEGEGGAHLGPQVVDLLLLLGYRGGVEDDQGSTDGSLKAENFFAKIALPCVRVEDLRMRVIMELLVDLLVFIKRGGRLGQQYLK